MVSPLTTTKSIPFGRGSFKSYLSHKLKKGKTMFIIHKAYDVYEIPFDRYAKRKSIEKGGNDYANYSC